MKVLKKVSSLILAAVMLITLIPSGIASALSTESLLNTDKASGNNYNVLVLNFDPVFSMADNKKQHELMNWWNDPHWLADEYKSDMKEISHGYASYTIADWIDIDEMPQSTDGKSYTLQNYYDTLMTADKEKNGSYWFYEGWEQYGYTFDYEYYLEKYNAFDLVDKGEIDEIWIFTGPLVGPTLYETRMVGKDAYWCNSPGLEYDCKPFVVYGFNYERGVGEMLEDAGHRAESIMKNIMGAPDYTKDYKDYTDWEKFTAYDAVAPGKAGMGNVHFAPNSTKDYEWGNTKYVYSNCDDLANYPDMKADPKQVNCETWGNGDIREHHKWWFSNFPHISGVNSKTGFYNNWWTYFTLDYINKPASSFDTLVEGDANDDGVFTVADVTVFLSWLLIDGTNHKNWKAVDFNKDEKLNVLDLCMMKQKLLSE